MNIIPRQMRAIHFIGIGGIGMSGIAEVLHHSGFKVQGSDVGESYNTKRLQNLGIKIFIGHKSENVENVQAVVVSTAIKPDNPELKAAILRRIPVMHRADMLAEIMRNRLSVAISGTHGKTTTTSLMAWLLDAAGFDPTVVNGGIINEYNTNARLGQSNWAVVEADESDGSFTRLPATIAVVTNIDPEHMEHYGNFENLKAAFANFVKNVPFYGSGVLCIDHPVVKELYESTTDRHIITYGFDESADVRATNVRLESDGVVFDLHLRQEYLMRHRSLLTNAANKGVITLPSVIENVKLPMMGRHNIQNALSVVAVAQELGVSDVVLKHALSTFKGVKRRFTQVGNVAGVSVIDDYAHHPAEIAAVLASARQATKGKIYAVVQPHRYSRLKDLFAEFSQCFNGCAEVLVSPVYSAGEQPNGTTSEQLVGALLGGGVNAKHFTDVGIMGDELIAKVHAGDIILFMGAGNITQWAQDFVAQFEGNLVHKNKVVNGKDF